MPRPIITISSIAAPPRAQFEGDPTMARRAIRLLIVAATVTTFYAAPSLAQTHQLQGIVVTNKNGQLTIKTPSGNQTIALPHDARVRSISGAFNSNKQVVPV